MKEGLTEIIDTFWAGRLPTLMQRVEARKQQIENILVLEDFYRLTEGRLPLIGTGGISSGAEAYVKIRSGASLVQLYTAMIYRGPGIAASINRELSALLERDGFANVTDAVGVDIP